MRLQTLIITGFKSFQKRAVLQLPQALTLVVGPNGCGKSNVLDAIRWCIGETSAKKLRGGESNDVLFVGNQVARPSQHCKVELVFDNAQGHQGPYGAYEKISIAREYERDGQSTYRLNGKRCRRRDIHDFLSAFGLGPRSYALIEQGAISQLIESDPLALRVYLEQIAGVGIYKDRREDTQKRLDATLINLNQLQLQNNSLAQQMHQLENQAHNAQRYQQLQQALQQNQWQSLALQWRNALDNLAKDEKEQTALQNQRMLAQQQLHQQEQQLIQARMARQSSEVAFFRAQQDYHQADKAFAQAELAFRHRQSQQQALEGKMAQAQQELHKLTQQQQSLAQKQLTAEALEISRQAYAQAVNQEAQAKIQLRQGDEVLQEAKNQRHKSQQQLQQAQHQLELLAQQQRFAQQQQRQYQQQRQQLEHNLQRHVQQNPQPRRDTLAAKAQQMHQAWQDAEQNLQQLNQQWQQANQILQETKNQHQQTTLALAASQKYLQQLQSLQTTNHSPHQPWPQHWPAASRLYQSLQLQDPKWQDAVEKVWPQTLAGYFLHQAPTGLQPQNLVWMTSEQTSDWQTSQPLGRLPALQTMIQPQLAIFAQIWCAPDWASAEAHLPLLPPRGKILLADGSLLSHGQILRAEQSSQGLLQRQQQILQEEMRITELQTQLAQLNQQQTEQQSHWTNLQQKRQEAKVLLEKRQQQRHQQDKDLALAQAACQHWQQQQNQWQEALDKLQQSQPRSSEDLVVQLQQAQSQLHQLQQTHQTLEHHWQQQQQNQQKLHQAWLTAQQHLRAQEQQWHAAQQAQERHRQESRLIAESLAHWQGIWQELHQSFQPITAADEQALHQAENALNLAKQSLSQAEKHYHQSQQALQEREDALRQADRHWQQLEQQQSRLDQRLSQGQNLVAELKIQWQELGKTPMDQPTAALQDLSLENLRQQKRNLQNQLQSLGPVNLAAMDQLAELSQQHLQLQRGLDDLSAAVNLLRNTISELDEASRRKLQQAFEQINASFVEIFPEIFQGGSANLQWSKSDDLLNAGIEILAHPPGKPHSRLQWLSGGEKTLTALAFIFAFFKHTPAPFCVLDEVDAPLDDQNVKRFAQWIKNQSARVQFVVISHNKLTMQQADELLGITMPERGISQVVGVDLNRAAQWVKPTSPAS